MNTMDSDSINNEKLKALVEEFYLEQLLLSPAKSRNETLFKEHVLKLENVKKSLVFLGVSFKTLPKSNNYKTNFDKIIADFIYESKITEVLVDCNNVCIMPPKKIEELASLYAQLHF